MDLTGGTHTYIYLYIFYIYIYLYIYIYIYHGMKLVKMVPSRFFVEVFGSLANNFDRVIILAIIKIEIIEFCRMKT